MTQILDIHTHLAAPRPQAVISCSPDAFDPAPDQLYSIGLHPWHLPADPVAATKLMRPLAELPCVAAIGETGLDALRGGAMYMQLLSLRAHINLSENIGKPLVIHCVRTHDMIAQLRDEMRPSQPWIVHGFRGKPAVARILLDAGCYLSLGTQFNTETARIIPADRLLAETDESPLTIEQIIEKISEAREDDALPIIAANADAVLKLAGEA